MDLDDLSPAQAISVLESMVIDDLVFADVSRSKARSYLRGQIDEQVTIMLLLEFQEKQKRNRADVQAQWGTSAAGLTGNADAIAIVGGPAGPPQQ